MSYTAGVLLKAGTAYLSRPSEFTPGFLVGFVLLNIYFIVLYRPLFAYMLWLL
jgi:hypothetical protein